MYLKRCRDLVCKYLFANEKIYNKITKMKYKKCGKQGQ